MTTVDTIRRRVQGLGVERAGGVVPHRAGSRADERPSEVIDRASELGFLFNGRPIVGFAGDTIASAIAATGIRTFSRSRRRQVRLGLSTVDRWDAGARLQVDEEPNVPTAVRLARDGLNVRTQHVWPDVDHDVKALARRVDRVLGLGAGDPSSPLGTRLRPLYHRLVRRVDIGGRLSDASTRSDAGGRTTARGATPWFDRRDPMAAVVEHVHPDIVVIGGGPAGLAAAQAAVGAGASVTVLEAETGLGGTHRWLPDAGDNGSLRTLIGDVTAGADVRLGHTVVEALPDGTVLALADGFGGDRLLVVHAAFVIVATGAVERRLPFAGDDLPGVLLSSGAARLANLWSVRPGTRALLVTDGAAVPRLEAVERDLRAVGTDVVDVVTMGAGGGQLRARGDVELEEVILPDGRRVEVDTLVTAFGATIDPGPPVALGCDVSLETSSGGLLVAATPPNVRVLGALAGLADLDVVLAHARTTGRQAAQDIARRQPRSRVRPPVPPARVPGSVPVVRRPVRGLIDPSDDRTVEELDGFAATLAHASSLLLGAAAAPGADVRTRVALASLAASSPVSEPLAERILSCPGPVAGPQLRTLASIGQPPVRRSPLLDDHVRAGARVVRAGSDWLEIGDFGDLAGEAVAATSTVILRDRSTGGLFELVGSDATATLQRVIACDAGHRPVVPVPPHPPHAPLAPLADLGVGRSRVFRIGGTDVEIARVDVNRWLLATAPEDADAVRYALLAVLQIDDRTLRAHLVPVADQWFRVSITGPRTVAVAGSIDATAPDPAAGPGDGSGWWADWVLPGTQIRGRVWWRSSVDHPIELHVPAGHAAELWRVAYDAVRAVGGRAAGVLADPTLRGLVLTASTPATPAFAVPTSEAPALAPVAPPLPGTGAPAAEGSR